MLLSPSASRDQPRIFASHLDAAPVIALVILILLKLGSLYSFGPTMMPDSYGYTAYAQAILDGSFRHINPASDPTSIVLSRPIGYPAVIAASKAVAEGYWAWPILFLQYAASLITTSMVYRLARSLSLRMWPSLGVAAAHASGPQFVLDQSILTDSLCSSFITIALCISCWRILLPDGPRLYAAAIVGGLIAAAFLLRDSTLYIAVGLIPLGLMAATSESGWPRKLIAVVLLAVPLAVTQHFYVEWNKARTGSSVVTVMPQWALFAALEDASLYDPGIFSGSSPIDQAARQSFKTFDPNEAVDAVVRLQRNSDWDSARIQNELVAAYIHAWLLHPVAMVRHTLKYVGEKQLYQAFSPIDTIRELLLVNTGSEHDFGHWRAAFQGQWWMIFAALADLITKIISSLLVVAFLVGTPLRFPHKGFSVNWRVCFGLWFAYLQCDLLFSLVAFTPRYIAPVLVGLIVVAAVNSAWAWTLHKEKAETKATLAK